MLRSVKQQLQSGPRDQSLRRAFNTVLRGGDTVDATIKAISTLKPSLKSRYVIEMREFDAFYPTEPRMVYTLGIMYYEVLFSINDADVNLMWILQHLYKLADTMEAPDRAEKNQQPEIQRKERARSKKPGKSTNCGKKTGRFNCSSIRMINYVL